ncbi:MAG TPA: lipase maturation factor family protein [Vicinamibacteria bacterium]
MPAAGAVLSALLLVGLAPVPILFALWALYLSLAVVSQVFLGYQWDALLLETGLLAVFLAPGGLRPRPGRESPPPPLVVWLFRWLLFRLMFGSGLVKLASGDPTWRGLTALQYHYWTQPLPTWVGWYAAHLPSGIHRASAGIMFAVELGAPLLLFAPRRFRRLAFPPLVGLQILIALTGNYAFFNLLAAALCLFALEDDDLPARGRSRFPPAASGARPFWPKAVLYPVAAIILVVSAGEALTTLGVEPPTPVRALRRIVGPLWSINSYGLFAVMTTTRPEIVVEGSDDGLTWKAYEFKWKPGDAARRPGFVAPHQPRLDWQMWFAALGTCEDNPWFVRFLGRLLEGSPPVLALLARNPFPGRPPRLIRAERYEYMPTDLTTRRQEGTWWRREARGDYCPVLSAEDVAAGP